MTAPHATATTKTSQRPRGTGYASGTPATRGSTTKIAATAANESWKPGSSARGRHPREQHERTDRERVPAVARPRDDPRERGQHAGDCRADDRRLPADGERVGEHDADRHRLAEQPPDPRDPQRRDDADRHDRDVLTGHGEEVHEAARLEVVAQGRVDLGVLPEHDPRDELSTLARRPAGQRLLDVRAQPVGDATDPAPPADDPGALAAHDNVHAASREPASLVEAGLGPTRRDRPRAHLEDGALRRRPLGWELEQDPLADLLVAEPGHLGRHAERERRAPRAGR